MTVLSATHNISAVIALAKPTAVVRLPGDASIAHPMSVVP